MRAKPEPVPRWAYLVGCGPLVLVLPFVFYITGVAVIRLGSRSELNLRTSWGGLLVVGIGGALSGPLYRLAGGRGKPGARFLFFSLIVSLQHFRLPALSWLEKTLRSGLTVSFFLVCFMLEGWFESRRKKPRSPMWDADADQPLAAKGPL